MSLPQGGLPVCSVVLKLHAGWLGGGWPPANPNSLSRYGGGHPAPLDRFAALFSWIFTRSQQPKYGPFGRAYSICLPPIIDLCTVTLHSGLRIAFSDHIYNIKEVAIDQKDHGFGGVEQNFKLLYPRTSLVTLLDGICLYLPLYTIVGGIYAKGQRHGQHRLDEGLERWQCNDILCTGRPRGKPPRKTSWEKKMEETGPDYVEIF